MGFFLVEREKRECCQEERQRERKRRRSYSVTIASGPGRKEGADYESIYFAQLDQKEARSSLLWSVSVGLDIAYFTECGLTLEIRRGRKRAIQNRRVFYVAFIDLLGHFLVVP